MPQRAFRILLGLLVLPAVHTTAQRSASTSLVVRVSPETRLEPQQIALHFRVSADGGSDVTSQPANVAAWVRPLPGQPIRLTAALTNLEGPSGTVPADSVRWTGSPTNAAGGGKQATCSSGSFVASGASQDLVQGWTNPGTLTCAFHFELTAPRTLPPGLYSGTITFAAQ